jgi:hypothetical protein
MDAGFKIECRGAAKISDEGARGALDALRVRKIALPVDAHGRRLDRYPRLVELALSAYKQWRYQPALLNGQPVEIMTTATIEFTLN